MRNDRGRGTGRGPDRFLGQTQMWRQGLRASYSGSWWGAGPVRQFPVCRTGIAPVASTLTQGRIYELGQAQTGDYRFHRPSGTESPVRDPSELPAAAAPTGDLDR